MISNENECPDIGDISIIKSLENLILYTILHKSPSMENICTYCGNKNKKGTSKQSYQMDFV
jgi:hypothetical protein